METPSNKFANSTSPSKEDIEICSINIHNENKVEEDHLDLQDHHTKNLIIPSPSGKSKKKSNNSSQAIKCFCRIRPIKGENEIFKVKENTEGTVLLVNYDQNLLKKLNNSHNQVPTFTFSKTFDETSTQIEVFDSTCKNLVEDLLFKKKSGLIFTYGMTCAGKTFTVIGSQSDPGILPLSLKYLYKQLELEGVDTSVYCNFVEIYNEEIYDLLSNSTSSTNNQNDAKNKFFKKKLIIKENNKKQFFLPDVVYLKISSLEDFNLALNKGIAKKVHAATNLNQNSSRSHTIFKIILKSSNLEDEELSLSIVDLAGSERANRTEAQGKELQEACSINQSLSILGKCMEALRYNSIYTQKKLVPFRESKLTKLFQEYFQGDQNVIMITNINPRREDFEETIRALNYSCIAKEIKPIKSKIVVNPIKKQVKLSGGNNNFPMNNFSENPNLLNGNMNLMQGGDSTMHSMPTFSSNFSNNDTKDELNLLKLQIERMKEEMLYLKTRDNNTSSNISNISNTRPNEDKESNSNENFINQDAEMNSSLRKFRPYTPYNSYNSYSNFPPRDNFVSRAFMFQQEMQMAMMSQMMQMMKKITDNQNNPYSMFLPNNCFNPGNIHNFQGKFLQSVPLEDETIDTMNTTNNNSLSNDIQFIPPNTGPLNLVFINSKFNDFHMSQKKKRNVRNKKKKENEAANISTDTELNIDIEIQEKEADLKENDSCILEEEKSAHSEDLNEDADANLSVSHFNVDYQEHKEESKEYCSSTSKKEKKKYKKKKKKAKDDDSDQAEENKKKKKKKKEKKEKKAKNKQEDILTEIFEIPEQSQHKECKNLNFENEFQDNLPINENIPDEINIKSRQETVEKKFSFGNSLNEKNDDENIYEQI